MKKRLKIIFTVLLSLVLALSTLSGCTLFVADEPISIVSIEKTATDGLIDTYTITYSDGSTSTFFITNGVNGEDGEDGKDGQNGLNGVDGKDGEDGKDSDIGVDDLFQYYKSISGNENKTYTDFLQDLGISLNGNASVINSVLPSAVRIYSEFIVSATGYENGDISIGSASGVIYQINEGTINEGNIDGYTYFLTNYHVIYNEDGIDDECKFARKITVYLYGSNFFPYHATQNDGSYVLDNEGYKKVEYGDYGIDCEYVGGCASVDVAIIRAKTEDVLNINSGVKTVEFADCYYVGETAFTVGNPNNDGLSVTEGIVSTESENITLSVDGTTRIHRSMRVDVALYHGNSGGGLFNASGKLIGLSHAGDGTDQNVNYAVPLDTVRYVAENLMYRHQQSESDKTAKKIRLGVTINTANSKYVYDSSTGFGNIVEELNVTAVSNGSIAETMGVQLGDVIKEFIVERNGDTKTYKLNRSFQLGDILFSLRVGDKISFNLLRNNAETKTDAYTVITSDMQDPIEVLP